MSEVTLDAPALAFAKPVLPRLSATEAQARSLIAQHGAAMSVKLSWPATVVPEMSCNDTNDVNHENSPLSCKPVMWQLGFAPHDLPALYDACDVRRDLDWAGAHLRLHLGRSALSLWVATSLKDASLNDLDEPLLSMATEVLLTQIFDALDEDFSRGPVRISDGTASGGSRLPHCWTLTARHSATGQTVQAVLEADALGLMLLANLIKRAPLRDNGIEDGALPVCVRAELGDTTLRASELKRLRPQDIIFINRYRVLPEGDLWLVAGGQGLRVRPMADSYCVTRGWTSLMNEIPEFSVDPFDMTSESGGDESASAGGSAEEFDVDAVPVRVTFTLGERHLTLGELRTLQPGEIFDLDRPLASGPVIVRANGAWLGTGDLVDVDGRIGVALRTLGEREA